jgi:hypothetical protein
MTNAKADARIAVDQPAKAMTLGIDPTEVASRGEIKVGASLLCFAAFDPSPTLILQEEHPAPWSYQEEVEGQPVPWSYQVDMDPYTDDARRTHVIRDACGRIVIQCGKFSKDEEEKLARLITAIPEMVAEIERLSAGNEQLNEVAAHFDELAGFAAKENADLRARNAELEATIVKLKPELCQALKAAAPRARGAQQTESGDEARIALAAKLLIEADISLPELVRVLARAAGLQIDGGAA